MPSTGTQFKGKVVTLGKKLVRGLYALVETASTTIAPAGTPPDSCTFEICTGGTTGPADLTWPTAGAVSILPDSDVPAGLRLYITSVQVYASTGLTGGTAGTVSLTLQDTSGVNLVTFTQTSLTATGTFVGLPLGSAVMGVTDSKVTSMQPLTVAKGLQALVANSSAGAVRLRIVGYFAT